MLRLVHVGSHGGDTDHYRDIITHRRYVVSEAGVWLSALSAADENWNPVGECLNHVDHQFLSFDDYIPRGWLSQKGEWFRCEVCKWLKQQGS